MDYLLYYFATAFLMVVFTYHMYPPFVRRNGYILLALLPSLIARGLNSLDSWAFSEDIEVIQARKKSKFKKISSFFGKAFVLILALLISLAEEILYRPFVYIQYSLFNWKYTKMFFNWLANPETNIVWVRILLAVPFILVQFIGTAATIALLSGNVLLWAFIYSMKIIPFAFFSWVNNTGKERLMIDE